MIRNWWAKLFVPGLALALAGIAQPAWSLDVSDWDSVEGAARGQTVYFNAWGGAQNINDYIRWAADTVQ